MALLHFDNVGVAALAGALPEHIQEINMDSAHPNAAYIENFVKQTGITRRHISITEQTSTDLGYAALNAALDKAGWEAQSLDALIFVTQTPDFNNGTGNAFVLHNHLNLSTETWVFDIPQGCASFPSGVAACASLMQQPNINRVALVSGDTMWASYPSVQAILADPVFLAGEGSTALLFENRENTPMDISLHSDGSGYFFLYEPWAGARNAWRRVRSRLPNGAIYHGGAYMDGLEITSFATMRVVKSIRGFLAGLNKTSEDYDGLVLHQANKQIVETMAKRLKFDMSKVPTTVEKYANTNGASVTLTMIDAYANAQTAPLKLLVSAFGIGLSWGEVSLTLDPSVIVPMQICSTRFEEDFLIPC